MSSTFTEPFTRTANSIGKTLSSPHVDNKITKTIVLGVIGVLFIILLAYLIYSVTQKAVTPPDASPATVAMVVATQVSSQQTQTPQLVAANSLYNSLLSSVPANQQYLANIQPLTAYLPGYLGPLQSGVFVPETYFLKALQAGIRAFFIPIGLYTDDNKQPPNFPLSGTPAMVARDNNGTIQSLNGMSLDTILGNIVTYRSSENSSQLQEPIILYIHADSAHLPDPVKQEAAYVMCMQKIATSLKAIHMYRLTNLGPYGSAVGGHNEAAILTQTTLQDLQSKILIFTNFNTKVQLKDAYQHMEPVLDEYVNFIYKPLSSSNSGSIAATGSRIVNLADISGSQVNWADQARSVWYLATQSDMSSPPSPSLVSAALTSGIHSIPLPFFMTPNATMKPIWDIWQGYAWKIKPESARYTKPDPVVPATPSAAMNARVSSDLQPGQTSVL